MTGPMKCRPVLSIFGALLTVVALTSSPLKAQEQAADEPLLRALLDVRLGLRATEGSSTLPGGQVTETKQGGIQVFARYTHWRREGLGITFALGFMPSTIATDTEGSGWRTENAWALPFMIGIRSFFMDSGPDAKWSPYLFGEAGPVLGIESSGRKQEDYGGASSGSDVSGFSSAFGVRLGIGANIRLSDVVVLGTSVNYGYFTDSLTGEGALSDHAGPTFEVGLGFFLPKTKPPDPLF